MSLCGSIPSFQNCSDIDVGANNSQNSTSERSTGEDSESRTSAGNGNGYDGKVYVKVSPHLCPDLSNVATAVKVISEPGMYESVYLIREACQPIEPRRLSPDSFTYQSGSHLRYDKDLLTEDAFFHGPDFWQVIW